MEETIKSRVFDNALSELIFRTATELPEDVVNSLKQARDNEEEGSTARLILTRYLDNLEIAARRKAPLCQDTGLPVFYITLPVCMPRGIIMDKIGSALTEATRRQYLRPNAVDPVTGENSGNNLGRGFPVIKFTGSAAETLEISLLLKGGGSENVSAQYSLPSPSLRAGRDMDGVRRVVIDAVRRAGGKGCPPGVIGVCIGGDRESGYSQAKRELLRRLNDVNPDPLLRDLEERLLREINSLGIGPQGLGGGTTLLGVKIGSLHRLPACYFVTVSYMCWAFRRRTLIFRNENDWEIN